MCLWQFICYWCYINKGITFFFIVLFSWIGKQKRDTPKHPVLLFWLYIILLLFRVI